jgi:hypothetical protein
VATKAPPANVPKQFCEGNTPTLAGGSI